VRDYEVDIITAQRGRADPGDGSRRPDHRQAGNGGHAAKPQRHPVHRRALAQRGRARRGRIPHQGVAYCPSCDGPLFKGKDVAVIGGGNSGVEAAIDLAGVVKHVTVLEFCPR
jgi:alkyl hydroperoxide reductase subunit F